MIVQMPKSMWRHPAPPDKALDKPADVYAAGKAMFEACGDRVVEKDQYDTSLGGVLFHQDMPKFGGPIYERCHALIRDLPLAEATLATTLPPLRRGINAREKHPDRFARLCLNGFWWDDSDHGLTFKEDSERLDWICEAEGIVVKEKKPRGKHALVMSQKFIDSSVRTDIKKWAKEKVEKYLARGYDVVVRTHPYHHDTVLTIPPAKTQLGHEVCLHKALDWADIVVAHTSTSAVNAVIAGVDVDTDAGNMASPVSAWPPVREQWLKSIAHTQWRYSEMRKGIPWHKLRTRL